MFLVVFLKLLQLLKQLFAPFFYSRPESKLIVVSADEAHSILKSPVYSRQIPNEWLIHTFSIVNPFTIHGDAIRCAFKNKVIQTLVYWKDETNYQTLLTILNRRIRSRLHSFQNADDHHPFCLSAFVKQMALDGFVTGILQSDVSDELLEELPDLIIHLWKHRTDQQKQQRLRHLLRVNEKNFSQSTFWNEIQTVLEAQRSEIASVAINDFDEKISNPLNIIIPGWETMWRVVFYSLLELLRQTTLLIELRQALSDPSKSYRDCVLLRCVIKETLRLYPPTKHIHRMNIQTGQRVAISVLQIHRDPTVWGPDALNFRPDRFQIDLTDDQKYSYLPFSISCPARHGFAYDFAGAMLAILLISCPRLRLLEDLPTDQVLDITRDAYNDLLVVNPSIN